MKEYLFSDKDQTVKMVQGAYKKLKSYLYFDKTLLFAKKKAAFFESDRKEFETTINRIADALVQQDDDYFKSFISLIDFNILPKKFSSKNNVSDVIQGETDHNQFISKLNFFIDMPIELQILDFLWTLLIGKMLGDKPDALKYAAATAFKPSVFTSNTDLYDGIDFESNRTFEPYFKLYSKWRKGAFDKIKQSHQNSNTALMCLDLKSFYYSVEFSFSSIETFFEHDERIKTFEFLTRLIEKEYITYTKLIAQYKKGIRNSAKTCIFPIGAMSALVLRELYLKEFDYQIAKTLSPLYYNRYVDDILLVLPCQDDVKVSKEDFIKNFIVDTGIAVPLDNNDLRFTGYKNIRIQSEKVNCFYFSKRQKTILLDIYAEAVKMNSSETNLLPDIDVANTPFLHKAYNIKNLEVSSKIRDLGFLQNNNYNATRFISALQQTMKNTTVPSKVLAGCWEEIEDFYIGSRSVEYSNNWRAIFELLLLCQESSKARIFYKNVRDEISKLDLNNLDDDEVLEKKKTKLLIRLKRSLNEKLLIAASLAASLDYNFAKTKKVQQLAVCFRESNLLNHTMISFPLLNYSQTQSVSLTETNFSALFPTPYKVFELDQFHLKWSPRYIHPVEFYIANFLYGFWNKNKLLQDPNAIFSRYIKHNNLGTYLFSPFQTTESSPMERSTNYVFHVENSLKINPKIALVNTKISEKDVLNRVLHPKNGLTIDGKKLLFRILNTAKEERVDILVFPEFYFPVQWLMDISLFAIRNQITIITGMQYMTLGDRAYNTVCTVIPTRIGKWFKTGIMLAREKNFYAPKERVSLSQIGFACADTKVPIYYIVDNINYRYSTILCYEFTDIASRANMKSQIEILFVPQLNKDTNYFSSIVESSARDLHSFIVQANTSLYGDSRITAPYKTQIKNIVQVKGGETDVVMISQIKVDTLIKKRKSYSSELERAVSACIHCKYPLSKRELRCKSCQKNLKEDIIKGTPPNF